jgi:hypothetical protein
VCRPTPALRIALSCVLVDRVAGGEQGAILPGMSLCRGDIADAAVPVFVVVPLHEALRPLPGSVQISKSLDRELRLIFRCAEQRLGEGVVIADARARLGWLDAEPVQHGQTVVAFRVAPLSPCSTGRAGLACTPSASAVLLAK